MQIVYWRHEIESFILITFDSCAEFFLSTRLRTYAKERMWRKKNFVQPG